MVCEICGNFGKIKHHIDYDRSNNNPDNLIVLCYLCHKKIHSIEKFDEPKLKKLISRLKQNKKDFAIMFAKKEKKFIEILDLKKPKKRRGEPQITPSSVLTRLDPKFYELLNFISIELYCSIPKASRFLFNIIDVKDLMKNIRNQRSIK